MLFNSEQFLNNLFTHMCLPAITKSTRFAANSLTLNDNFIYNVQNNSTNMKSCLLLSDLSDHLTIFIVTIIVLES